MRPLQSILAFSVIGDYVTEQDPNYVTEQDPNYVTEQDPKFHINLC